MLVCISCIACDKQDYMSETEYVSAFCVVESNNDGTLSLLSDDSLRLNPVSSKELADYKADDRVFVTYNVVNDNVNSITTKPVDDITILDIQPVLVSDAIKKANLKENIDDPLWLQADPTVGGGFLNFRFNFKHSDLSIKHNIILVYDDFKQVNGTKKLYMTFGHNAKMDPGEKSSPALASFRLSSIDDFYEADTVEISVLEGLITKTYKIHPVKK